MSSDSPSNSNGSFDFGLVGGDAGGVAADGLLPIGRAALDAGDLEPAPMGAAAAGGFPVGFVDVIGLAAGAGFPADGLADMDVPQKGQSLASSSRTDCLHEGQTRKSINKLRSRLRSRRKDVFNHIDVRQDK